MASIITMPRFGATMEEGMINSWSVEEGDQVSKGDVLGEIAIEKLSNELLAEEDGVVLKLVVAAGETVPCGEPILILGAQGETLEAASAPQPGPEKAETTAGVAPAAYAPAGGHGETPRSNPGEYAASATITPKALQLAQELGLDYHFVQGTGRLGMITREDVRLAASSGSAPKAVAVAAQPSTRKMSSMQLAIAKAMDESLKSTAQTTISMDLDAGALVRSYRAHKEEYAQKSVKLTYTALLVKIVAEALGQHPLLRTVIQDASLVTRDEINLGIAIDVADGLVVPNIKDARRKDVRQIASELADLAGRAKENTLTLDEISGGTFTLTNLGTFGIKYFTPVLNPGESGILGVGTIQEVPYVQNGGIFVRPVLNVSLTHDHRVVNGAPAARFLQTIQQVLHACKSFFQE